MTSSPIVPSIGRIVLYTSSDHEGDIPAIVTGVTDNDTVNLHIFPNDFTGATSRAHVAYAEDSSDGAPHWHWMPYQIQTAKDDPAKSPPTLSQGEQGPLPSTTDSAKSKA